MLITILALFLVMIATVWFHAAGLSGLRRTITRGPIRNHLSLAAIVSMVLALHLVEIAIFAAAIWILNIVLNVGDIVGDREFGAMDYYYYSAETFTSLGLGDLRSTGSLRLVTSIEPLNGLILIAWSGAFTYWAMEHFWSGKDGRR